MYCKIYPSIEDPDNSCILFSTKNAAKIRVPASIIRDIESQHLSENEQTQLRKLGFLVDDAEQERAEMLALMEELDAVKKSVYAKVVLNLDCNLACRYCFEGTRKGKFYMTEETVNDLIGFIMNRSQQHREEIRITYYGGEPLLSSGLILDISRRLKAIADTEGLKHTFSLVTNGTLLTRDLVAKLKPLGLIDASVTVDGPSDVHDKYRPFRSGNGSFDTILGNIKDVCDIIPVQIGGNYTKENFKRFPLLLDYLMAEGLIPDRVGNVQFYPVTRESDEFALSDFREGCISLDEPWLVEAWLYLRGEILRRGYRTKKVLPMPCMMEIKDSFVINYNGDIYKCAGLIDRKEFCVGNLESGIKDYRHSHNLDNWKNEECLDCSYLPLCFGGCRYMKLVREGSMEGIDCRRPYFDAVLESLVLQDIKYANQIQK
jgi:uncharacterized protein